ncbi:MAG: hypothetical protein ACD_45C00004G0024 [uncultured bacterium]|nr:MAG: hypothetical protein ACD_45C00004G0024 [uncultured bacterium]
MADESKTLTLKTPIPSQVVNEGAKFGPLHLTEFIQTAESGGRAYFRAELQDGRALPQGLICTSEGIIDGIAGVNTQGTYKIIVTVVNDDADELQTEFDFTIKSRIAVEDSQIFKKLKAEVWEALGKNLPLPEMKDMLDRPITAVEIYYLLQRFATFTIWDVYNLDSPTERQLLTLSGASPHYHVYDRGCCLIGSPKDLFSHERTLEDALQTARAIAREVYQRGWVVELAGFDKMVRAAWVEIQHLGEKHSKPLEILHYTPSSEDVKIYTVESASKKLTPGI